MIKEIKKCKLKQFGVFILMGLFWVLCCRTGFAAYDNIAPTIGTARIVEDEVYAPSRIHVQLSDIVEEHTGIVSVSVWLERRGCKEYHLGDISSKWGFDQPLYTGDTCEIFIPINGDTKPGTYFISYIMVTDARGNTTPYDWGRYYYEDKDYNILKGSDYDDSLICTAYGKPVVHGDEFDVDLAISNPNIPAQLQNMEDGQTARIFVDGTGNTVLPKTAFDAIKGTNKKILMKVGEGIQWLFSGRDIINETKNVDCKVDISATYDPTLATDRRLLKLDFASNGILPGKAKVKLKSNYLYQIYDFSEGLNLYYLDTDNKTLSLESSDVSVIVDNSESWCEFDITHNSTFVLSDRELTYKEPKPEPSTPVETPYVKLNATTLPLQIGKSTTALKIKGRVADDKVASWKSSKPKVVSVTKKGKLTAKKVGTAYITVTMKSGATAKCKVKVQKGAVKIKKLIVNKKSVTLKKGKTFVIKATKSPLTATDKVAYSTSNKKVATVNGKGKVKAVKKGKATITVKAGKKLAKVNIRVK